MSLSKCSPIACSWSRITRSTNFVTSTFIYALNLSLLTPRQTPYCSCLRGQTLRPSAPVTLPAVRNLSPSWSTAACFYSYRGDLLLENLAWSGCDALDYNADEPVELALVLLQSVQHWGIYQIESSNRIGDVEYIGRDIKGGTGRGWAFRCHLQSYHGRNRCFESSTRGSSCGGNSLTSRCSLRAGQASAVGCVGRGDLGLDESKGHPQGPCSTSCR